MTTATMETRQWTVRERNEWFALIQRFEKTFETAARQRSARPGLEWIAHERGVMLAEVNAARAERGLPSVDLAAVEKVERLAVGHSDYGHKFALGCAELAMEER